jgi:hypothetical protein
VCRKYATWRMRGVMGAAIVLQRKDSESLGVEAKKPALRNDWALRERAEPVAQPATSSAAGGGKPVLLLLRGRERGGKEKR